MAPLPRILQQVAQTKDCAADLYRKAEAALRHVALYSGRQLETLPKGGSFTSRILSCHAQTAHLWTPFPACSQPKVPVSCALCTGGNHSTACKTALHDLCKQNAGP